MDKLKQIQEKIAEIQAKSAVAPELKAFATLFLKVLAEAKSDFSNISKENQAKIDQAFAYLEQEHAKLQDNVSQVTDSAKKDFQNSLNEIKDLIKKIQTIKPIDGVDGYTPVKGEDYFTDSDIKEIKDEVLKDIPIVEEETGESIVYKINELPIDNDELKISAKHIKDLPEQVRYYAGNSGIKEIIAGTNITVDNSNLGYPVISSTGGGTPGGSDTQLQYNNAGSFGGISGATTNGTAITFTTGNLIANDIKASGSGGLHLHNNTGQDCFLSGAGGGINNTAYGALKLDFATATTVPYLDASKNLISSAVTPTELGYLSGVTSAIQTQLNTIGSAYTLAAVSALSTTTPNSTYTMTSTIPVEFRSSDGNPLLYLDETNERIGIGTSSPTDALTVARTTDSSRVSIGWTNSLSNFPSLMFFTSNGTNAGELTIQSLTDATRRGLFFNAPGVGGALSNSDNFFTGRFGGASNKFYISDNGTSTYWQSGHQMYITAGVGSVANITLAPHMMISSAGLVGIGTTSPDRKLDVLDASNPQLRLTYTDGSVYTDFQTDSSGNLTITPTGTKVTIAKPVLTTVLVSAKTTTTSPTSTDSGTLYTNEGATSEVTFNLPTAVAGLAYTFYVQDTDGLKIVANTGDTIRIGGVVSASAGYAESLVVGSSLTLTAINATEWVATSSVGSWSLT